MAIAFYCHTEIFLNVWRLSYLVRQAEFPCKRNYLYNIFILAGFIDLRRRH